MSDISKKISIFLPLGFLLIPLIFIIIGCSISFNSYQKIYGGEYEPTMSIIKNIDCYRDNDGDSHCSAFVDYSVKGKEYKNVKLNFYSSTMNVGDTQKIFYKKSNPAIVTTKGDMLFGLFFAGFGAIFLLIFSLTSIANIKKMKMKKNLLNTGRQIYVDVRDIVKDYSTKINGRHPYKARCIYTDEYSNIYEMLSESTFKPLDVYFEQKNEELKLKAYVNPNNLEEYYIPIDYLFEK